MNEDAFTYEYYDNLSYFFAALAMIFSLVVLMPVFAAPSLLIWGSLYALICVSYLLYRFIRIVGFVRKYKSLSTAKQRQVIKRARFSFKWVFPLVLFSAAVAFLIVQIFDFDLIQSASVFYLSLMMFGFFGLRVLLHDFKKRLASVRA